MIKLAIQNIRNSFIGYRNIFVLLIVSQLMGILLLLFIYGVITNYNIKIEEKNMRDKRIYVNFEEPVSASELKELLPEVLSPMEERLSYCFFYLDKSEMDLEVTCLESFSDGKFHIYQEDFTDERLVEGRYPTSMELTEGASVAFAYGERSNHPDAEKCSIGDRYVVCGKEYEIVGVVDGSYNIHRITIPINSCTEDMKVSTLSFDYKKFPTVKDHELIVDTMRMNFGGNAVVSELKLVELDSVVSYNSIIVLAFMIGGIAAFDTILVYRYILKKRQRQMAIFSIEGATRLQRIMICAIEIILITVITTVIGLIIFEFGCKQLLIKAYKPSMEMYTLKSYLCLMLSYSGIIVLGTSVLIAIGTGKKVLDIRRG